MFLRDYQRQIIDNAREGLKQHRAFMIQSATGSGKTIIFSAIVRMVQEKNKDNAVWIITPRNELADQAGEHLERYKIQHGYIRAGMKESRAYNVHVCSKQTLDRRWEKIKKWPALCIIDEAHLNPKFQKELYRRVPESTRILGFTATPELSTGEGLKEPYGIYGGITYGPSIPYLTECGFLAPIRYFAPPADGIEQLRWKKGEVDEEELDEFLRKKAIYGKAVDYYSKFRKKPDGSTRTLLGFTRNVKAAQETARQFREAGFEVRPISGDMPRTEQKKLIGAARARKIDGLVSCELVSYGVDIKCADYIFMTRPTKSRALYFQMVGRGLRPCEGKGDCLIVDHVNNIENHCDLRYPGLPPFFIEDPFWNFEGNTLKKRKKDTVPQEVRRCPFDMYSICVKDIRCPACERYVPPENQDAPVIESVPLREREAPGAAHVVTPAEKREAQDEVLRLTAEAREAEDDDVYDKAVQGLVEIAKKLGYSVLWTYWRICETKTIVDIRALHAIARVCGYKSGWCHFRIKELRERLKETAR